MAFATVVWSLGCLLYELIVGDYLFRDEDWSRFYVRLTGRGQQLISDRARAELLKYGEGGRQGLEFLQSTLLVRDPRRRPTGKSAGKKFDQTFAAFLATHPPKGGNNAGNNAGRNVGNGAVGAEMKHVMERVEQVCVQPYVGGGQWTCLRLDGSVTLCFPGQCTTRGGSARMSWQDVVWMAQGECLRSLLFVHQYICAMSSTGRLIFSPCFHGKGGVWTDTVVCGGTPPPPPPSAQEEHCPNHHHVRSSRSSDWWDTCAAVVGKVRVGGGKNRKKKCRVLVVANGEEDGVEWLVRWCALEAMTIQNYG